MNKQDYVRLDAPEKQHIMVGVVYSVLCFFSLPFILLLFSIGLDYDAEVVSWFEIAFHGFNFIIVIPIFREYLSDSLINAQINKEKFISVVAIAVGLMLGVGLLWHFLFLFTRLEVLYIAGFGTIPLSEMDIFTLCCDVALGNPIFGTLCMALLVPLTTSCLYYAVGFVPAYNVRPWLGYLVLALAVAFPRVCNALTYWDAQVELVLYLAQLPVHMIACWAYKKIDSIWAAVAAVGITNLIACLLLNLVYFI